MKRKILLTAIALLVAITASWAQDVPWNKDAYPDYDPVPHIDQTWVKQAKSRMRKQKAKGQSRPDHWNNAESKAFPPVVNQSAGSCGSASRIYYMFTHEMNAMRDADGSRDENIYPTHFTWLLTWVSNQGKEIIAQHNGVPNSSVYGGRTYSEIFGYQDCDDGQSNYGWMQGYDKWFHAMHNRIAGSGNFPYPLNTAEGREMLKNYLWNHCGDERFVTGGIAGVGVASGCTTGKIPATAKNKEIGVSGMNYVKHWGESVDHALTIVGYDDRIQFDLDGNGVSGEEAKDEVGAWIIVNSWGSWMNNGFIYCPYAEARPTRTTTGYWTPEYYTARWNYRPLRTLKVTMDYSHRSEIALYVGVAQDLNATKPEKSTFLRHFYYSGLGKGAKTDPDPEMPMLGKWADGDLHTEPMEFGYDLTDLTSTFDLSRPLKYFFWVEPRSYAVGEGHIYKASIVDYNLDREGVETAFDIPEGGTLVQNAGKKTEISTIVRSEVVNVPRNLAISGTTLTWQRPTGSCNPVTYNIYLNGELAQQVAADNLSATTSGSGTFAVSAVYDINGYEVESEKSTPVIVREGGFNKDNDVLRLDKGNNSTLTLAGVSSATLNAWTLEFWVRPNSAFPTSGNGKCAFGIKASSGKFFFKTNANKEMEVGFDGGDYKKGTTLATSKWSHIAIVEDGGHILVYVNGKKSIDFNSGWSNSGLGGANDLVFGQSEGTTENYKELISAPWEGYIDEIRFWNVARTQAEIKACYEQAFVYPMVQNNLTHYYQMNVNEDSTALVSAIGGADIALSVPSKITPMLCNDEVNPRLNQLVYTPSASFALSDKEVIVGQPVTITDMSAPSTCEWAWTFTGAEKETLSGNRPILTFNTPGQQAIHLTTTSVNGETAEYSETINVTAAEAPVADFTMSATTAAVGEHISFINQSTPLSACTYEWTFEDAEVQGTTTTNAAATFISTGTHRITLTATNSAGSNSCTKTIDVEKVAPQPAFNIRNNIAILGEKVYLIDETKYEPSSWMWNVSSDAYAMVMNGKEGSLTIDKPGIYSVSLTATNEKGSSTTTRSKAITVCNADGGHGLAMGGGNDSGSETQNNVVEATSPFDIARTRITIAFWLYPTNLVNGGNGIGSDPSTLLLTTNADGSMDFQASSKVGKSDAGYVIAHEWHHYAITYSSGTVTFYRDGQKISTASGLGSSIRKQTVMRLGGDYPFTGIIDELQMWSRALTESEIRDYGSKPIEDPSSANGLLLYYQFNQTSGDVIDSSGHNLTGVRTNFGPDGDAWASTRGIFFLNFENTKVDVTSRYLKNYKLSFQTASGYVNGTSRFKRLATETETSPWVIENAVTTNGITTCWHVDANKGNSLVLSTNWDGFADEVKDLKLYQTVTLEPGAYELSITPYSEFITAGNYLVAASGRGLPNVADIKSSLAYSQANKAINFIVPESGEVSLGLVSNQSGKACMTIGYFTLTKKDFNMVDADGETVVKDIEHSPLNIEHSSGAIYDLGGRKMVNGQWSMVNGNLPKGVYIHNGKKVVVK